MTLGKKQHCLSRELQKEKKKSETKQPEKNQPAQTKTGYKRHDYQLNHLNEMYGPRCSQIDNSCAILLSLKV